jgi:uncharacterized protein involved in outer membrane biogenesis
MKKVLLIAGAAILILIVVLMFSLGRIIKTGVNTMGPKLAGVPVKLETAVVNPLTGMVQIKGLVVGNPVGFNTPSAMELGDFKLKIKMSSLFSEAIVIEEILISEPQITYEKSLKSSNLSTLQANLTSTAAETPAPAAPEAKPEKKKGEAKKVIIDAFLFDGAKVNVTITALGGKKLTIPLPPIHMQNIGRASGGAKPVEVISEVFNAISKVVFEAVAAGGEMAGKALKDVGNNAENALKDAGGTATDAAKSATDTAKSATEGIKKGFGGLLGK